MVDSVMMSSLNVVMLERGGGNKEREREREREREIEDEDEFLS
jgi:hypothetical protein